MKMFSSPLNQIKFFFRENNGLHYSVEPVSHHSLYSAKHVDVYRTFVPGQEPNIPFQNNFVKLHF